MTMPEKILIDTDDYDGHMEVVNEHATWATPYIRADIVEELAQALERLIDGGCDIKAAKALTAFRAITP